MMTVTSCLLRESTFTLRCGSWVSSIVATALIIMAGFKVSLVFIMVDVVKDRLKQPAVSLTSPKPVFTMVCIKKGNSKEGTSVVIQFSSIRGFEARETFNSFVVIV